MRVPGGEVMHEDNQQNLQRVSFEIYLYKRHVFNSYKICLKRQFYVEENI